MNDSTAPRPERLVLMNPGPVITDDRVRAALAGPDMCHREPEFSDLLTRVRHKTTLAAGGDGRHTSVVLTGSGTAAVEAAVSSAVPHGGGLLVIDNGHYGERFRHIADAHGIRAHRLELGWATPVDLDAVDRALAADPGLTHVGVVHHETSSGMLNDVAAVTRIAHAHGREVVVDAVSSIGAERISLAADGVDWLAGSANKCLEGAPGLGFVSAARTSFEALAGHPAAATTSTCTGTTPPRRRPRPPRSPRPSPASTPSTPPSTWPSQKAGRPATPATPPSPGGCATAWRRSAWRSCSRRSSGPPP
nr:2-aminoethylphosphonate:pyruvate aminotransferase [Streptomyces sp. XY66]